MRIRLHGIDCPEKDQPFGQGPKQFASTAIFGKTVRVDSLGTDRYGRTIGMVWYDEPKKNLNEELLKAGLAWPGIINDTIKTPNGQSWSKKPEPQKKACGNSVIR